jgi:hypothetical protein
VVGFFVLDDVLLSLDGVALLVLDELAPEDSEEEALAGAESSFFGAPPSPSGFELSGFELLA